MMEGWMGSITEFGEIIFRLGMIFSFTPDG